MKKTILSIFALMAVLVSAQAADDRVLLTIDGEPSTVEEFMYIYQKNNPTVDSLKQSVEDYLQLFINFKLKVRAAEEVGIDTTEAFRKELEGYRNQAVPKYMVDKDAEDAAVQKAYKKMLWDRKVRHIAIQCPQEATLEQETEARAKIERALLRVTKGEPVKVGKGKRAKMKPGKVEDFAAVAMDMSEDPAVKDNEGLLGWITPWRYVYSLEEAAYNTPVGGISEIFRTPFGFHILKVEEELPHREIHAAHIMKMAPQNNEELIAQAKLAIDSLYDKVKNGANFAETAMQYSEDRGSAQRGGDLNWFSRGQMVPAFENVAFDMTELEPISEPVLSRFGWHIIQFLGSKGTPDLAEIRGDIQQKISRSEAKKEIDDAFIERLKKEYNFTVYQEALEPFYTLAEQYGDVRSNDFQVVAQTWNDSLFAIADKVYTQRDFTDYLYKNNFSFEQTAKGLIDEKFGYYTAREVLSYERANLENKYPELRNLMQEYHDGILLFEISLRNVWDKASLDTAGITTFFKEHKKEYTWDEKHFKGYVVYCKDKSSMKAAKQILRSAEPDSIASYIDSRINIDSTTYVHFEKGLWTKGMNPAVDKYGFKDKKVEYTPEEEFPYVFVYGKLLKSPEEYTDERGKVTADYQDYLEKEWIAALRAKYKVDVNKEVLHSIEN